MDLEKKGSNKEIAARICEFLVEPHESEKSEKEEKIEKSEKPERNSASGTGRPRRSAAVKAKNRGSHIENIFKKKLIELHNKIYKVYFRRLC